MRTRITTFVMSLVTMLGLVVAIGAGRASASTHCGSMKKHYSVRDGSVPIKVAWIDFTVEACISNGSIVSSTAVVNSDTTGPGDAAGFDLKMGTPTRTSFNGGGFAGGSFGYTSKGTLRACVPETTLFCGDSEDFYIHAHVDMLNALYVGTGGDSNKMVIGGRVFKWTWSWKCTNKICGVKL